MEKRYTVSLIISTYNNPPVLELVLMSVQQQSSLPDEIIIADDGSRDDTRSLVERFAKQFSIPLVHVWHEDDGYRLSEIKNKSAAKATGEYIIFIDGDLMLHPHFIADFRNHIREGWLMVASRVFLSEDYTGHLLKSKSIAVRMSFSHVEKNWLSGIRIPWLHQIIKGSTTHEGARGGLMGLFKKDFIAVNGFDEAFRGWGREDSDLFVRLLNTGVQRKNLKFAAVTYHLWHPVLSRQSLQNNDALLAQSIATRSTWCKQGIAQYL